MRQSPSTPHSSRTDLARRDDSSRSASSTRCRWWPTPL